MCHFMEGSERVEVLSFTLSIPSPGLYSLKEFKERSRAIDSMAIALIHMGYHPFSSKTGYEAARTAHTPRSSRHLPSHS